jgi:hypothetical protein
MTSKQRARAAAKAIRARKAKAPTRKLQDFDSKEGPNDEPDPVQEEPLPRFDNGPEQEGRAILTPQDDTAARTRVVDDGSAGQTASQAVAKRKADVKAAGAFARRQLAKAGLGTKGTDEQVAARFREANHAVAQRRTDEGLQRAKSIGASSALAANKANSKAALEAQERARAKANAARAAVTARARASATVSKTVAAAKAKATASVSAKKAAVVTQITGRPPAGTRVPTPAPGRPAPKPVAPKKKKVGGGRHLT